MNRLKLTTGAASFAVALAVPLWVSPFASGNGASPANPASALASSGSMTMGSPASTSDSANGSSAGAATDWRAMDKAMAARDRSFPAATKGEGGRVLQPTVLPDGTKEFHLTAEVAKWEIEPGKFINAWTYNGAVPGPTIQLDVGDKVRIVVQNKLPESTSVHWHGLQVPNNMDGVSDVTQDPIKPGGTFTYAFTANRPAVSWYHSHHDGTKQVTSGLFGAILIGHMPLPAGVHVSQQVNFELQDAGDLGLTINGKSFPATKPVRAKLGDWVQINYINAGTTSHPMHLHGVDQLIIAKDGFPLPQPYKADTVNVSPGERYSVLVHADQLGKWAWHCHIFPHSEGSQGMFGLFDEMWITK